jgi:hypothetical protein
MREKTAMKRSMLALSTIALLWSTFQARCALLPGWKPAA